MGLFKLKLTNTSHLIPYTVAPTPVFNFQLKSVNYSVKHEFFSPKTAHLQTKRNYSIMLANVFYQPPKLDFSFKDHCHTYII